MRLETDLGTRSQNSRALAAQPSSWATVAIDLKGTLSTEFNTW